MSERALRFRIGLLVIGALLLLAFLATIFGSLPTLFRRTNAYTVEFADAPNISKGTPVRRSGVRIGQVDSIDLNDETGEVSVHISIDKRFTVHQNEQPTLVVGLLGGDSSIDFIPKKEEQPPLERGPIPPGSVLQGKRQPTVGSLVSQASEVVPNTQELLNDIRKSLQSVEKLTPLTEDAIREYRDLARTANKSFPQFLKTNDELQQLARAVRESVPDLRHTNDEVQTAVRNFARLTERLDLLVQTNQDKVIKTVDNLNDVLARVGGVLSDENQRAFSATLKNIRTSSDNLPSISKNTDEVLQETRETIRRMRDAITRMEDMLANLQIASKSLAERGPSILKNVDEGSERFSRTMADFNELLRVIGEGDGTLRRFISDPALYNHLDEVSVQIIKLMPRINRMLADLEVFSDKLARHPESLGLGGVVHPSSGIKDVPSTLPQSGKKSHQ
jgi:phospholipid/cholesterol/gamma-HCH transport system substrate-binding protein